MSSKNIGVFVILAGGLSLGAPALAASWADFEAAFPNLPCQDGWMACLVGGERVDPDMAPGPSGIYAPADLRVDWFDLDATRTFSPFASMSDYPLESAAVAVAEPEPAADTDVPEPDPVAVVDTEEPAPRPSPATVRPDPSPSPSPAPMVRPDPAPAPSPSPSPGMVRPSPSPSPEPAPSMVRPKPGAAPAPAPAPAPSPSPGMVRPEPAPAPSAVSPSSLRPAPAPDPVAVVAPEPTGPVTCDDLVRLEPSAMMGKLSEEQAGCLEASLAAAPKQTDKDKISRVLMTNAWSKGDKRGWEKLVKRHLEEIDQSDPDLCYKYALYMSKMGAARADGVIKWSDVALENRTVWVGETYKERVYNLYKLKASAAQEKWKAAEEKHATAPTDETKKQVEDWRGKTKTYAREWYEYAKEAGKDTTKALTLCISAAGTADFCEGR